MKIQIINGPNLNLLGKREPEKYGNVSFEEFLVNLRKEFPAVELEYFQSNVEGELINKIHETGFSFKELSLTPEAIPTHPWLLQMLWHQFRARL
jgi:3-dehydroquinate dehydratase-2